MNPPGWDVVAIPVRIGNSMAVCRRYQHNWVFYNYFDSVGKGIGAADFTA